MLRSVSRKFNLLNLLAGTACRFDLFAGRFRELGGLHGQLLGELAVAEHLDAVVPTLDQTSLTKFGLINRGAVVEALEVGEVHDRVDLLEDVGKSALGQAAMQRHLSAFESAHAREAAAGLLSLFTASGGLAVARTWAAADALLRVARGFLGFEVAQFHVFLRLSGVGCRVSGFFVSPESRQLTADSLIFPLTARP